MTSKAAPPPDPDLSDLQSLIEAHLHLEGPLLPILHAVQAAYGYVPAGAHEPIAHALNTTKAELHGVVSFYHDFREAPAGRHVLKICRAEACQAVGANTISEKTLSLLVLDWHGTTPDGRVTVEPVYCLGLCANGPAAMINDRVLGRVTPERLLEEVAS